MYELDGYRGVRGRRRIVQRRCGTNSRVAVTGVIIFTVINYGLTYIGVNRTGSTSSKGDYYLRRGAGFTEIRA